MADPISIFGLVAAIIQIVDRGTKVIVRLHETSEKIGEVPRVFRNINIRLPLLIDILNRIKSDTDDLPDDTQKALLPVIGNCLEQVKMLDQILVKVTPALSDSRWKVGVKVFMSVKQESSVLAIEMALKESISLLSLHQTTVTGLHLAHRPVSVAPVFMVPFERDDAFIAREDIIMHINTAFRNQSRVALAGIGGVGKSQIAIEYCYRFKAANPQSHVFWVFAGNSARFHQAYEEIGRRLRVPGCDDLKADKTETVRKWLCAEDSPRWLMVVDNADDMDLFYTNKSRTEAENVSFARFLPVSPNGKLLITARDSRLAERLAHRKRPLRVQPMSLEDAVSLLSSKLPGNESYLADSEELLKELGFLPLTITQAAAFMSENSLSIEKYLSALRVSDEEFKEFVGQDLLDPRRDGDAENCITRTLMLSFIQISRQQPRAAEMLSLMAVLDRQRIPKSLLRNADEREIEFITALGTLQAFFLVSAQKCGEFFEMHQLVQLATKSWLELSEVLTTWQENALAVVEGKIPKRFATNGNEYDTLLPHAQVVLTYNNIGPDYMLIRAELLCFVANFEAQILCRYSNSYAKALEAYSIFKSHLPQGDYLIRRSLQKLGSILSLMGNFEGAEGYLREAWKTCTEESARLNIMDQLIWVLIEAGSLEEAAKLVIEVQEVNEKLLGPNNSKAFFSKLQLGIIRYRQGRYGEAGNFNVRELEVCRIELGVEHTSTLGLTCQEICLELQERHKRQRRKRLCGAKLSSG